MTSFAQVSLDSPLFQSEAVMQSIDSDVERMNFKLVSVESSIRRMLAQRRPGDSENSGSWYANHAKSRKVIADAASDLLISRKKQQDKLIRLRLKRDLEHERMLISDVAVPDMKLSRKTAALVTASRKKLFEKKIQLVKLNSELKNMNLQSVIEEISNADVKAKFIEHKKNAANKKQSAGKAQILDLSSKRKQVNSPVKVAWAVQSPKIAPHSFQPAIQPVLTDDSSLVASNTFITALPVGNTVLAAPSPKELHADPTKKTERSRYYSILTDKEIPSRSLDPELELISDCSKGSKKFIMRKWQLLKILDENK